MEVGADRVGPCDRTRRVGSQVVPFDPVVRRLRIPGIHSADSEAVDESLDHQPAHDIVIGQAHTGANGQERAVEHNFRPERVRVAGERGLGGAIDRGGTQENRQLGERLDGERRAVEAGIARRDVEDDRVGRGRVGVGVGDRLAERAGPRVLGVHDDECGRPDGRCEQDREKQRARDLPRKDSSHDVPPLDGPEKGRPEGWRPGGGRNVQTDAGRAPNRLNRQRTEGVYNARRKGCPHLTRRNGPAREDTKGDGSRFEHGSRGADRSREEEDGEEMVSPRCRSRLRRSRG